MKKLTKNVVTLFALALLLSISSSWAQSAVRQQSQLSSDEQELLYLGAQRVIVLIDQGLTSELGKHISPVITKQISREAFVKSVYNSRRSLGVVINRELFDFKEVVVTNSGEAPEGLYVAITFLTNFVGKREVIERVTFRQDDDKVWRIAGYALR